MLGATLYIIACTARNRFRQRVRRLKEPRYLIGAAVGIAYLVFSLFIRQRAYEAGDDGSSGGTGESTIGRIGPPLGGLALAGLSLGTWLMPFGSNLLSFTQAEVSLLFTAPVSRRGLLLYRLTRSHLAVFVGALIMAVAYPIGSLTGRLRGLLTVWVLLMTGHVFFTGVTLVREHIRRGRGVPVFAWPALALSVGTFLGIIAPLVARVSNASVLDVPELLDSMTTTTRQEPAHLLMTPFSLLVRPLFAQSTTEFVVGLGGALAVYAVTVLWLVWADGRSIEVADVAAERLSNPAARRATVYRFREVGWQLSATGRPETVFFWKAMLRTFRPVDRRDVMRVVLVLAWMIGATLFVTRTGGLLLLVGVFATWGALFTALMAPQIVRMDLREDLAHLEWLKGWPVRGATVIRGEILWPTSMVTGIAWTFGLLALALSLISSSRIPLANRSAVWLSVLALIPGVVLAQYTIHNAIAVIFPGWVPLGASRPRGVDAAGQRLILLVATWLALILALVPGISVTAGLAWLLRSIIGPWVLPIGALVTTMAVVGEMLLVTAVLGPVYERLDITSTERPD